MLISLLVVMGILAGCGLAVLAGLVALVVTLTHRSRRVEEKHSARITREIEKIGALQASGRISVAESTELRQALEDQSTMTEPPADRRRLSKASPGVLAGVCGGFAEWMNWDPTLVRVGYALATLLIACFPGIITYVILAVVMPPAPDAAPTRRGRIALLIAVVIVAALALLVGVAAVGLFSFRRAV